MFKVKDVPTPQMEQSAGATTVDLHGNQACPEE